MAVATTSTTITVRIPRNVYDWLAQESQKCDQPIEEFASVRIEEAMRMAQLPGIFFVGDGVDRRARLIGGMDVWEMIMIYQAHGREGLLDAFDFPEFQIDRALTYYEAFPDEIDEILEENSQPVEYWMQKYPELNIQVHEW